VDVLNIQLESAPQIPDLEQRVGRIFTLDDKVSNFVPRNTKMTSFAALDVIFQIADGVDIGKFMK
jgi:hypothetical protein